MLGEFLNPCAKQKIQKWFVAQIELESLIFKLLFILAPDITPVQSLILCLFLSFYKLQFYSSIVSTVEIRTISDELENKGFRRSILL